MDTFTYQKYCYIINNNNISRRVGWGEGKGKGEEMRGPQKG